MRGDCHAGADGLPAAVRSRLPGRQPPRGAGYTGWQGIAAIDHPDLPSDVTSESSGLGGYGLMEQGKVDAFVVTDSSEVESIADGKPLKVFRGNDYFRMAGDDYLFTNELIQKSPDVIVSVLRAIHLGRLFTMKPENWDKVVEYVAAFNPDEVHDKELAKKIAKQIALWTDDGKWTSKLGLYDPADWTAAPKCSAKPATSRNRSTSPNSTRTLSWSKCARAFAHRAPDVPSPIAAGDRFVIARLGTCPAGVGSIPDRPAAAVGPSGRPGYHSPTCSIRALTSLDQSPRI